MATNISTVYPDVQLQDSNFAILQPVLLTIGFSNPLPSHLIQGNIPIQVSVSIAEEYRSFITPLVEVTSTGLCLPAASGSVDSDSSIFTQKVHIDFRSHSDDHDIPIPFFPLPKTFDYSSQSNWTLLAEQIEEWLVADDADISESSMWIWARDAFWLAFVAAHPHFPGGKWPMWDPRIPLEGTFIEQWLDRSSNISAHEESIVDIRCNIWEEFYKNAALFYPYPLISSD